MSFSLAYLILSFCLIYLSLKIDESSEFTKLIKMIISKEKKKMERLSKEEYNVAVECLKRYNYNCTNILNIQSDILSINILPNDGMPKTPYYVGDTTLKKVMELEENEELQNSIKEYKAVVQALQIVNDDCKYIFEEYYRKSKTKWEIIDERGLSDRTFSRRKQELIYAVNRELKRWHKCGEK